MKGTILSTRYAKSLLTLAIEQNSVDEVNKDMELVAQTCAENRDLSVLLRSPIVKRDKKEAIIQAIFSEQVCRLSGAFMDLLTAKGRESHLEGVAESYTRQYKVHKGIETAMVTTAVPLDNAARTRIMEIVTGAYKGAEVDLQERVDKDIIGGIILRVGDRQVDASIARKLTNLQTEFSKNLYVREF